MKPIVVIPTYNESQNISELIACIRSECQTRDLDILVVDSASPDGTAAKVREAQQKDPHIFLIEQSAKLGLGRAYLEGMEWVLSRPYDVLMTMDADMSHHPKYLNDLLREIETHDLAVGSRYVKGGGLENWPKSRLLVSRFANWYACSLTGLPFHDLTSGFQCFRIPLLKKVLRHTIRTEGYAFLIELKFLSIMQQARYKEVPIIFSNRTKGDSKISKRVMFESMLFVLTRLFRRHHIRKALAKKAAADPIAHSSVIKI